MKINAPGKGERGRGIELNVDAILRVRTQVNMKALGIKLKACGQTRGNKREEKERFKRKEKKRESKEKEKNGNEKDT